MPVMIHLQLLPRRQAPAPAHPRAAHTLRLQVTRAGVAAEVDHLVLIHAAVGDHGRGGDGDTLLLLLRDRAPAHAHPRQKGVGVTPARM
jgi:hypothetical protein